MSHMEQPEQPESLPFIIDGPPWEKKHELGFFVAFIETIKAFLIRPAATFSVMRRQAGIGDALVYTVAIQVFTFLWTFAITEPKRIGARVVLSPVPPPTNLDQAAKVLAPSGEEGLG